MTKAFVSFSRNIAAFVALLLLIADHSELEGQSFARRVPDNFYGINGQWIVVLAGQNTKAGYTNDLIPHLISITNLGIEIVRADVSWRSVETTEPTYTKPTFGLQAKLRENTNTSSLADPPIRHYFWGIHDPWIANLALYELDWLPVLNLTPTWAQREGQKERDAPKNVEDYGAFCEAFVRRYGPKIGANTNTGVFWRQNPSVPYRPVKYYELWNEPNLQSPKGDPKMAPETYADLFMAGLAAIKSVDSNSVVMSAGMSSDAYTGTYLLQAFAHRPDMHGRMDLFGWHGYTPEWVELLLDVADSRHALDAMGETNKPMAITEVGWVTDGEGGHPPITEAERADCYRNIIDELSRTDCSLRMVVPHTWWVNPNSHAAGSHELYYGIADQDGVPADTALAYGDVIQLYYGQTTNPPPRRTIHHAGRPAPDTDGDGVVDELDDEPINTAVSTSTALAALPSDDPLVPPRVLDTFFGMSDTLLYKLDSEPKKFFQMTEMKRAGVQTYYSSENWKNYEPNAPTATGVHHYNWAAGDRFVAKLARQKLRLWPVLTWVDYNSTNVWPGTPLRVSFLHLQTNYAAFVGAYAERYGRDGTFWQAHPDLPYYPVVGYEIWQHQNHPDFWLATGVKGSEYAQLYLAARDAIMAHDAQAFVTAGALSSGSGTAVATFISQMYSVTNLLGNVDGFTFSSTSANTNTLKSNLISFRNIIDGQNTNSSGALLYDVPFVWTDAGWATSGTGTYPPLLTEAARTNLYTTVIDQFSRCNLNLAGIYFYQWWSPESSATSNYDWTGIVNHEAGAVNGTPITLKASGTAFRDGALLFAGRTTNSPPMTTVLIHPTRPKPDQDGDGYLDEADNYPFDSAQH